MNRTFHIQAIAALHDNYIWLLHDGVDALVVDPADAAPVLAALGKDRLQLKAILLTHHHADHTAGVPALRLATGAAVYGPARESLPEPVARVQEGDVVTALGISFAVLHVPGHTAGHIAFHAADQGLAGPVLFCGDTLFSAGCGRLFEGTAAQLLQSLDRLAALPASTQVYCGHEYTLANLRFAQAVEPDNPAIGPHWRHCQALREQGLPTLPSSLATELKINPFLRSRHSAVRASIARQVAQPGDLSGDVAFFAALRTWKNNFRE